MIDRSVRGIEQSEILQNPSQVSIRVKPLVRKMQAYLEAL